MTATIQFVCPACRVPVAAAHEAYECGTCGRRYPVVLDIPDFRIAPDSWLSIEEDRAKGLELEARTAGRTLAETVQTYWQMTPGTSAPRARRFIDHVLNAERRSREWLAVQRPDAVGSLPWLDLGCGTADLSVELGGSRPVLAIDIAFRWLVVARRRLQEHRVTNVTLICADARALPLADASVGQAFALGLMEHLTEYDRVTGEARRVLCAGGVLYLRTTNRFSLLPEPHVGIWGVGFLPRSIADRYVRWRGGEGYTHLRPPSAGEVTRALSRARFSGIVVRPAPALPSETERLGAAASLAGPYNRLARLRLARAPLAWLAPLIEARGVAR
jgi:SAM-dependent methyltransferase